MFYLFKSNYYLARYALWNDTWIQAIKVLTFYRPEALGVVAGCLFLMTTVLFIPIIFGQSLMDREHFPHNEVIK